jgi:hypothetical protein
MSDPKRQFVFQVVRPDFEVETFRIGPHTPSLKAEDVLLIHKIWLQATRDGQDPQRLHHSDIVSMALTRLARDLGRNREDVMKELRRGPTDSRFGPPSQSAGGAGVFNPPRSAPSNPRERPPTEPR